MMAKKEAPGSTRVNHMDEGKRASMRCPNCRGALRVRSNRVVTELTRELFLQCMDAENCGATYRGQLSILNGIMPSANPREGLELRMSPPRRRAPANDTHPPATTGSGLEVPHADNDDDRPGTAIG
jgi:hypothetical protein